MADQTPESTNAPTKRFQMRRARILREAIALLNREGLNGMTLGEVASRLDLVPTAVIYYYKNKEELASACMMSGLERYHELINHAEKMPEAERVYEFVRRYFALLQEIEHGNVPSLPYFSELRALNDKKLGDEYVLMFKRLRTLLDSTLGRKLDPVDRNIRTHQFLSQILWISYWIGRRDANEYSRIADRFYDVLVNGLIPNGGSGDFPHLSSEDVLLAVPDESQEVFLRIATRLMNARGYKGASVDQIAAELNLTKGAFYHHYKNKEDLAEACFERTVQLIQKSLRVGETHGNTGAEQLLVAVTLLVEHQLAADVPLIRVSALPLPRREEFMRRYDMLTLRFAGIIADGVADGSVRAIDPVVAASMITGGLLVAATEAQYWAPDLYADTARDVYIRPMAQGILADA